MRLKTFSIAIIFFFSHTNLSAGLNTSVTNLKPFAQIQNEKKMKNTVENFNLLLSELKKAYYSGDRKKAYVIANAYLVGKKCIDGTIPPDKKNALKWFELAYKANANLAALQIAFLKYIQNGEIFSALDLIEEALNKEKEPKSQIILALGYGSITLEYARSNQKYVRKAISIIKPIAMNVEIPTIDYTLANLLNINGELAEANKFLNAACNSPKAPSKIKEACMKGQSIKVIDNKTGKILNKGGKECKLKSF